jgi:hypothetical protein
MWSADGYSKLDFMGIQIYGCVDAYSRQVQWLYVGHSSHTQVSVLRQYLDHIAKKGFTPDILRTDRGVETPMLADAHYSLRKENDGHRDIAYSRTLPYRNHSGDYGLPLALEHCYYFGKSTRNLAVESWWRHLAEFFVNVWIVSAPLLCIWCTSNVPRKSSRTLSAKDSLTGTTTMTA